MLSVDREAKMDIPVEMERSNHLHRPVLWAAAVLLFSARVVSAQGWWPPKPLPGYNLFNEQQEVWLGEIFAELDDADAGIVQDAEANAYLQAVGDRLTEHSKRTDLRYRFFINEDLGMNAGALPGGRIYVGKDLFLFFANEAELATILGHEIGHVVLRQQAKTWSRWLTWGIGVDKVGDKEDIRKKVKQLEGHLSRTGYQQAADLFMGIRRGDELWADKYGIWNMYAAGYDPEAAVTLFTRLAAEVTKERPVDSWASLLDLLTSSYPPTPDRVRLLKLEKVWMKRKPDAVLDTEAFRAVKARLAAEK
jgi:predicted Zn-dependent protease